MAFLADPIINRIATSLIQLGLWGTFAWGLWYVRKIGR